MPSTFIGRIVRGLVFGLGLTAIVAGNVQAQAPEKRELKIGLAAQTPAFLPFYLADDQKYFADEGLKVEIVTFRSGSDLARALVSGAVDVASGALVEALVPIKEGMAFRVFYGGMNNSVMDWYAVPSIKSVAESKGKRYGITSYGSLVDFVTRYALRKNGLDPQTDVKIVPGGSSSARLSAMEAGQLDVNLLIPPAKFIAAEKGYNRILAQSDIAPDYPYEVIYAPASFLAKNPNTVKAMLRGFARGATLAKTDKDRAIKEIEKRTGVETKHAIPSYDEIITEIHADGRLPSEAGMKAFWEITILSGMYAQPLPDKEWLDRTFIDSYAAWSKK